MQHQGITVIGDMKVKGHGRVTNTAGAAQPAPATPRPPGIDVLVITALKEEYDAARAVAGLSNWQEHGVGGSEPHVTATYRTATGDSLSVALVRTVGMGGRNVGALATTLVNKLRPTCLAMCGVCAGNPASTAPGDVVVAAPAYQWDEGKHGAAGFQGDHQQFPLDTRWVRAAQDFDPSRLPAHGVATDREAAVWFLERLHNGQSPRTHPARRRYFRPRPGRRGWSSSAMPV